MTMATAIMMPYEASKRNAEAQNNPSPQIKEVITIGELAKRKPGGIK
ncbi:MAG: hypothetical protein J6V72_08905 [Kiritimatiellae bacterium]|nr:hypothetical protein [Kiritimatiellia bacterium]